MRAGSMPSGAAPGRSPRTCARSRSPTAGLFEFFAFARDLRRPVLVRAQHDRHVRLDGEVRGFWQAARTTFVLHVGRAAVAGYAGIWALLGNLVVTVALTALFRALRLGAGTDATAPADYAADAAGA